MRSSTPVISCAATPNPTAESPIHIGKRAFAAINSLETRDGSGFQPDRGNTREAAMRPSEYCNLFKTKRYTAVQKLCSRASQVPDEK